MDDQIARVREHDLRTVWEHEERDFTRWLAENIELLGAELGVEIEDAHTEASVGSFSSDIVARELNTGEPVVIENQYGKTDHDHLGKLLTYSSGKDAGFSIWLAESFRSEHRSVLEWLNESGPKDVKFFAIRPRVLSIDDGEVRGFEFDVVVEPNDWERELTGESLSETERRYREFYAELVDAYAVRRPQWSKLKPGPRNYLTFSAGLSGVSLGWVYHQGPEFAVEVYIQTADAEQNLAIFEALHDQRADIEATLETELIWQRLPDKNACRIKWAKPVDEKITDLSSEQQAGLIEWGVDSMAAFQEEFEPRIAALDGD